MQATKNLNETSFEQRYYESLRRRILAPSVGHTALATELPGLERRRYQEITSGLAEALPGVISTHYTFEVVGGKLVAGDNQEFEEIMSSGLRETIKMASQDDFYGGWLPERARHELDEFREQQAMAGGGTDFNTCVTFSPYSEEYDSPDSRDKLIKAGQKPYWRRGMLRIAHWDGQQMHIFTRSIDNSSVDLFRRVARAHLGYEFEAEDSTSMLGERIHLNIEDQSWMDMADQVTLTADTIIGEQRGGTWTQGRSEDDAKDLQVFVESQAQVVGSLLTLGQQLAAEHGSFTGYKEAFDEEMYNHIALLEERLELGIDGEIVDVQVASGAAGSLARAEGRNYDMCGNVLSSNNTQTGLALKTGFESLTRLANKKIECPECKSKVIVPTKELKAGRLYCGECDSGVDVCTGKKFSKGHKTSDLVSPRPTGLFETISRELAEYELHRKRQQQIARRSDGIGGKDRRQDLAA